MPCRLSASPAEQLNETESGSEIVSSPAASIFVMRDNPRQKSLHLRTSPKAAFAQNQEVGGTTLCKSARFHHGKTAASFNQHNRVLIYMKGCAQADCAVNGRWGASTSQHHLQMQVQERVATLPAKAARSLQQTVMQAGRPRSHRSRALPAMAASPMTR